MKNLILCADLALNTFPIDANPRQDYAFPVTAKSVIRISTLSQSATALIRSAFFTPVKPFMVGCAEALRSADPLTGSTNSVQPATLFRLVPDGGSSQLLRGLHYA